MELIDKFYFNCIIIWKIRKQKKISLKKQFRIMRMKSKGLKVRLKCMSTTKRNSKTLTLSHSVIEKLTLNYVILKN